MKTIKIISSRTFYFHSNFVCPHTGPSKCQQIHGMSINLVAIEIVAFQTSIDDVMYGFIGKAIRLPIDTYGGAFVGRLNAYEDNVILVSDVDSVIHHF